MAKLNAILIKAIKNPIILDSQQERDSLADGAKKHNDFYEGKYQPSEIDLSTSEDTYYTYYSSYARVLNWMATRNTTHLDETVRGVRVSTCHVYDANCWESCVFWPQGDSEVVWRGDTLEEARSFHSTAIGLLERFNFDSLNQFSERISVVVQTRSDNSA